MYNIYAVFNAKASKIYVGQTKNLKTRLELHNNRTFKCYTSRFPGKWELIYHESVTTRSEALSREKQLKSYRGREFIKSQIPKNRQPSDQRKSNIPEFRQLADQRKSNIPE